MNQLNPPLVFVRSTQLCPARRHDPPHSRDVLQEDPNARIVADNVPHQFQTRRFFRSLRVRLDARYARGRAEHVPLRTRQLAHDGRRLAADQRVVQGRGVSRSNGVHRTMPHG